MKFLEQFPSLKGAAFFRMTNHPIDGRYASGDLVDAAMVKRHCLDKEKVREVLKSMLDVAAIRDPNNFINTKQGLENTHNWLIRELGLEESKIESLSERVTRIIDNFDFTADTEKEREAIKEKLKRDLKL